MMTRGKKEQKSNEKIKRKREASCQEENEWWKNKKNCVPLYLLVYLKHRVVGYMMKYV